MRKLKLLIAAAALLVGTGTQAQTWTPSEVGAGSFYIYNVGAKGYIVAGNNWGTRASINAQGGILTTLAAADGAYTISTASTYAGKFLGTDGYVDQNSYNWTFEAVEGEANVYKMKKADGNYLFADAGATTTSIGADPGTDYAKWMLVTRANRIADLEANASKDNPIDATFLLTNPNFDRNSTTSMWEGGVALGGNNENFCAEKFNTTFDVYQTVTDAPKGAYALAFQGFYRYGGGGVDPAGNARKNGTEVLNTKLYANDTEAPLMSILDETTAGGGSTYDGVAYPNTMSEASTAFSNGLYSTSMDFTVDVNTIKIGVKKTVTVENDWTIFDNARLTYYGPVVDFTIYKNNLQTQVDNAEALYGKLPSPVETNLKATVTQYNKEYDNVDDYIAAIAAIKAAVENAQSIAEAYATCKSLIASAATIVAGYDNLASGVETINTAVETVSDAATINDYNTQLNAAIAAFNNWLIIKATANNLIPVANDNAEANTTLSNVYTTQEANVQSATLETVATDVPTATSTLKEACTTYVTVANPVGDGAQFDCTFMLTNPDVTSFWTGAWNVRPNGWYNDQEGGNFQVMANEEMGPGGEVFMEYWSENPRTSGFVLYQKAKLPEGTYKMTGRVGLNQNVGGTTANMTFSANDTDGTQIAVGPLSDQSVEFVNTTNQEVKIGIKAHNGNCYRWIGINKIGLYKIPAKSYAIKETEAWDNTVDGAGDVTLTRTIKAGVNTLVLPFSMTQAEVESYFGAGSKVYEVKSYDAAAANISFGVKNGISANEPCLLIATETGSSYKLEGRTIVAGAPVKAGTNVTMTGTYAATMPAPTGSYIVSGDKLYKVDSDVTLKNTRAYITVTEPTTARVLTMSFGDDATGIATIENGELKVETGVIYDLSGRKVTAPAKGIYVINGKKIVK